MGTEARLLEALLRQTFCAFVHKVFTTLSPGQTYVPTWHVEAIAWQLERVRRGECHRLIINMPPRSLKSITASVAFPAFVLGHDPSRRLICVSYSADLARKHANDFRAVLGTSWYRRLFPATRIGPGKNTETEIELTHRGFRLSTSVGGTLTGRGGDIVVIDDPLKPDEALSPARRDAANQWFTNTLLSRLDDKRTGAIVIVMQRIHMDDLTGFVREMSDDWEVLSLPAIAEADEDVPLGGGRHHPRRAGEVLAPGREPMPVLEALRRQIGSDAFSAQYQQAPVPPGGAMIKKPWVKRYGTLPTDMTSTTVLQSWDTASKGGPDNDWSVCTTWHLRKEQYCLVDVYRDRIDYPTLKLKVAELAQTHGADQVLVEESGTAIGLLAELAFTVRGLTGIKPDRDKQTRMSIASAKIEAGQVFFPLRAPWLSEFETELFSFPAARHDDQVDSVSQALNHESTSWFYERFAANLPEFERRLFGR